MKMPHHIIGKTLGILEVLEISGYTNELLLFTLFSYLKSMLIISEFNLHVIFKSSQD